MLKAISQGQASPAVAGSFEASGEHTARILRDWWQRVVLCDFLLTWADRYRRWLFAGLVCVYLAGFNGLWRMQPDAALYLSLGRNLVEGKGYTYLGQPHHLVYPGWPWLIAGAFKLFGTSTLVPVHVLSLVLALVALALTYRLFLLRHGQPTAVIVTIGVGITKTFYTFAFELWTDLPFAVGVLAFFAGCEAVFPRHDPDVDIVASDSPRRAGWYDWLLMIGGLAFAGVTRPTIWPLLLAIVAAVAYAVVRGQVRSSHRMAGVALLGVIVVGICLLLARHSAPQEMNGEYERYALQQASHLGQTLLQAGTQNLKQLLMLAAPDTVFQVRLGIFNAALGVIVLALGVSLFRERVLWGLWFCALVATIVVILPLDRYFLPVIPLLVFAWWKLLVWINHRLPRPWGNLAFAGLIGFAMGMNGSKVGGVIIQQHTRPFLAHYDHGQFAAIPALAREIHERLGNDGVVLIRPPYGRATEFLSHRYVVNGSSSPRDLSHRRVLVVEPDDQDIREVLRRNGIAVGPEVWSSESVASPAASTPSPHALGLHETSRIVTAPGDSRQ